MPKPTLNKRMLLQELASRSDGTIPIYATLAYIDIFELTRMIRFGALTHDPVARTVTITDAGRAAAELAQGSGDGTR